MELKKRLKKAVLGIALVGTLLGTGCSKENKEETKDSEAKMEQRIEGKSEMRQKIAYLDEYVAAVESGKNKEQAYHEFALKMADGNAKKMAEMQKQVETLQKKSNGLSYSAVLLMIFAFSTVKDITKATLKKLANTREND